MTKPAPAASSAAEVTWDDLRAHEIPIPRWTVTRRLDVATALLSSVPSGRICLKAVTNAHKARQGLVETDLGSPAEVEAAWARLQARCSAVGVSGQILVQEQIARGAEVFVGFRRDPIFGPVVLLGWGGTLAERLDRVFVRFLPLGRRDAVELTRELLGEPDPELARILLGVSALVTDRPHLAELDLNPVILGRGGPVAVDLRALSGPVDAPRQAAAAQRAAGAMESIAAMLGPKSVAVVGASSDPKKLGGRLVSYLLPYAEQVDLLPVNARMHEVQGLRAYAALTDLPRVPDVAVIATDAAAVPDAIAACGRRGIRTAVVLSSGFAENGRADLEDRVRQTAADHAVRICGVNTIGVFGDVPLTFSQAASRPREAGGVGVLTQSGALGGSLLLSLWSAGVGTSRYICAGNQTDLDLAEYLAYLADDAATTSVLLFVEGVRDGRRLRKAMLRLRARHKPVIVLRAAITEAGQAAARSHSAALAGSDRIYRQVLTEAGAVTVSDLTELVAAAQALEWRRGRVRRVGFVSTSGGACSLLADLAAELGLAVPALDSVTQRHLRSLLPRFAAIRNPVDTTAQVAAQPGLLGQVAGALLASARVDAVLVAVTTILGESAQLVAEDIARLAAASSKPVLVAWTLPETLVSDAFATLRAARVPVSGSLRLAMVGLAALSR